MVFLISNSSCSLLVYRKSIDVCILTYILQTFYNHLSEHFSFLWDIFSWAVLLSVNKESFISSFQIFTLFSLFFLAVLIRTFSIMLNSNGESISFFCSWSEGYSIIFLTIKYTTYRFLKYFPYQLGEVFLYSCFAESFYWIRNECWNLSNAFSAFIDVIMFILVVWWIT